VPEQLSSLSISQLSHEKPLSQGHENTTVYDTGKAFGGEVYFPKPFGHIPSLSDRNFH